MYYPGIEPVLLTHPVSTLSARLTTLKLKRNNITEKINVGEKWRVCTIV